MAALTLFENDLDREVRSFFRVENNGSKLSGKTQQISSSCTELEYRVYTTATREEVVIAASPPCEESSTSPLVHCLTLRVTMEDCPRGFSLDRDRCICDEMLNNYTQRLCNMDNNTLSKDEQNFWIGVQLDENSKYLGLVLYPLCPFNYCLPPPVNINLTYPDAQCSNYRSGILCGQCKENKSLTLSEIQNVWIVQTFSCC